MFLKDFYSGARDSITITAEQGSLFAKEIAKDFNPLHDVDSKRFLCARRFVICFGFRCLWAKSVYEFYLYWNVRAWCDARLSRN